MNAISKTSAVLDRHQARRNDGVPTVSVLAGSSSLAARAGRLWAAGRGRAVVESAGSDLGTMAGAWVDRLAAARDLASDAVASLAVMMGETPADLGPRIARMSSLELGHFLEQVAWPVADAEGAGLACRWLLGHSNAGKNWATPGLADRLGVAIEPRGDGGPSVRALVALAALIPPGSGPVLLVARSPSTPDEPARAWVESAARATARLAMAQPCLTAILAVEPAALGAYLQLAPESREKALIRSGVVAVAEWDGIESDREPAGSAILSALDESDDQARSEAERSLFEYLESSRATAGLFELNRTIAITFGSGRSMEVDLFSAVLGLAIEVDGYYHFRDEDAYRRDRRKDYLLQTHGYLVVRVLADDVVSRPEEVLAMIHAAVAFRRPDGQAPKRDPIP